MNIAEALGQYTEAFKAISDTARIDAECLIINVTKISKTSFFSHPETELTALQQSTLHQQAQRRLQGEPVAYIIGHKEFWDLNLTVNADVLIPRPETECLVEWLLDHYPRDQKLKIADLGVGSGAIALALAKERPDWSIHATDYSQNALAVAKNNAQKNQLHNVHFFHGEWYDALPEKNYDIIASNPPYIDSDDKHLKHLSYEPISALDGGKDGLDAIKIIIHQGKAYLKAGGLLIFEHGYDQRETVLSFLQKAGYSNIEDHDDLAGLPRFCSAYS